MKYLLVLTVVMLGACQSTGTTHVQHTHWMHNDDNDNNSSVAASTVTETGTPDNPNPPVNEDACPSGLCM